MSGRRTAVEVRFARWVFPLLAAAAAVVVGCGKSPQPASGYSVSVDGGGTGEGGSVPATCASAADCPPPDSECMRSICLSDGFCGLAPKPMNAVVASQAPGDCLVNVCDGAGGVTTFPDDADVADDHNGCTSDACLEGTPVFTNRPAGASCAEGGVTATCDGNGGCSAAAAQSSI